MGSEYDPLFRQPSDAADLAAVRERFRAAAEPYLSSPWSWAAWGVLLPAVALATPALARAWGFAGAFFAWSAVILVGGGVEALAIRRAGGGGSALASWAMRSQGNLSLVALALSAVLVWSGALGALPGLWLLLLGHSFFSLGGLSYRAFRRYGLLYQLGGLAALWPGPWSLAIFAFVTGVGNLALAAVVWRRRRG